MSQYRGDYNQQRMQALEDTVDMLLEINKMQRYYIKTLKAQLKVEAK